MRRPVLVGQPHRPMLQAKCAPAPKAERHWCPRRASGALAQALARSAAAPPSGEESLSLGLLPYRAVKFRTKRLHLRRLPWQQRQ